MDEVSEETYSWVEGGDDIIEEAIRKAMKPGHMLERWVLVCDYMDEDSDPCVGFNTSRRIRKSQTLGLLGYAAEVEKVAIFKAAFEDD